MPLFFLSIVILVCGCNPASNNIVTLCTNRQEIAAYSETFNTVQSTYRLEIQYRESAPAALNFEASVADLVIMENLGGKSSAQRFRSLDSLFGKSGLDPGSFYSRLLLAGQYGKQQMLLPVSFNLPVLIFDSRVPGDEVSAFMINLDDLPELALPHNRKNKDGYVSMGFAPRWNPDFLVQTALMRGAAFSEGQDSILSWNDSSLRQTIEFLRAWTEKYNGGGGAESVYAEKYLYDPPYRQVTLGRVKYAYTTVADFFLLPENRRISLDFRWLAQDQKIYVPERILFAGIPEKGRNHWGAEAFLAWFFTVDSQRKLLELSRRKMPHLFGIASGFSALREINEEEFPRLYPHLVGHIPPEDILVFPAPVPYTWNRIKAQVVIPWMQKEISADQPNGGDMAEQLRGWLQHQSN